MLSMFSEVGRVLNVRGFRDTETGKPKGYAFIEYESAASAMSAIRTVSYTHLTLPTICSV